MSYRVRNLMAEGAGWWWWCMDPACQRQEGYLSLQTAVKVAVCP